MKNEKKSVIRTGLLAFIAALVILLVVIVVNVVGLSLSSMTSSRQQTVLWRGDDIADAIDLTAAYGIGQARARKWASDAVLVRAEAAWRPTREGQKMDTPPVSWSLYYYSAQSNALASALVTGETVFWVPPIPLVYAPRAINDLPPFDVDVAWLTFRAAGGDDYLLRHKDAMINFRLQEKGGTLVWSVSAFDDRDHYAVIIDALTGTLVQDSQN